MRMNQIMETKESSPPEVACPQEHVVIYTTSPDGDIETWLFNPQTHKWTLQILHHDSMARLIVSNRHLFLIQDRFLDQYNPITNELTRLTMIPFDLSNPVIVEIGNTIYILNTTGDYTLYAFTLTDREWSMLGFPLIPYQDAKFSLNGDEIIVTGKNYDEERFFQPVSVFNRTTNQWHVYLWPDRNIILRVNVCDTTYYVGADPETHQYNVLTYSEGQWTIVAEISSFEPEFATVVGTCIYLLDIDGNMVSYDVPAKTFSQPTKIPGEWRIRGMNTL